MTTVEPRTLPEWWQPLATRSATLRPEQIAGGAKANNTGRPSAVLIVLGEQRPDSPDVLLLERAHTLRNHAGQPAFPGGKTDPDDIGPVDTALREANEEVGLRRESVQVVNILPAMWLPPSNFLVTPVLAWWHSPHPVSAVDTAEVARVERVPIAELVNPENRVRVRHPRGYIGPAFAVHDMLVWGFTAIVLSTLLDLAEWSVPWDTSRVVDLPA